ncbi:CPBP family intramembrane glutamic endopeptidase [Nonomuraea sp. NPDC049784]|uniref:CPBP family intramembrane glutamic endopeptidase n=1 Tax=Nonomuraea sp. NPDC049784 TaxID=3154361 RepID=UPI0033F9A129
MAVPRLSHRTRARYILRRNLNWLIICLLIGGWLLLDPRFVLSDIGFGAALAPTFFLVAVTAGAVVGVALAVMTVRRRGHDLIARRPDRLLILQSSKDLPVVLSLVVTAGVAEELFYRGFLIALFAGLLDLPTWTAVAISSIAFAFAHLYQGVQGMLRTGVIGVVLAIIYLSSGSLFVPIVLHLWLDLMSLVVVPWLVLRSSRRTTPMPIS